MRAGCGTMAETSEGSGAVKQIWDSLIVEHPVLSVIGALLVVALTCGGAAM